MTSTRPIPIYTGTLTATECILKHPACDDAQHFSVTGRKGEPLHLAGKIGKGTVNVERTEATIWVGCVRLTMSVAWAGNKYVLAETDYAVSEMFALPGAAIAS